MQARSHRLQQRGKLSFMVWARWLLSRLRPRSRGTPRLALLERLTLAPRQALVLVEADGRRLLVATSPDASPAFYPLDRLDQLNRHEAQHLDLHSVDAIPVRGIVC